MSERLAALLNPFRQLLPQEWRQVVAERKVRQAAEVRYQRLLDAYKAILEDQRYAAVRDEMTLTLGHELTTLVRTATTCTSCRGQAERIQFLQEVVGRPLTVAWDAATRSRLEPEASDAGV